jgi:hypothetical protein
MEVRDRRADPRRGDARIFVVHRRGVEGADQRSTLVGADWRTIQPFDSIQWSARRTHRPFAFGAVGDRKGRDLTGRIVPRDHGITRAPPAIVALSVRARPSGTHGRPPRCGIDRYGIELDEVSGRTRPATRDPEHDRWMSIFVAQAEASRIELEPGDGVCRPSLPRTEIRAAAKHGVPRRLVGAAAFGAHTTGVSQPRDIGEPRLLARAQIQHATSRRVPRPCAGHVHVYVILI